MSKHIDLIKIQEELGLRKEARVLIPGRPIKKMLGHLWKRYIKNPTGKYSKKNPEVVRREKFNGVKAIEFIEMGVDDVIKNLNKHYYTLNKKIMKTKSGNLAIYIGGKYREYKKPTNEKELDRLLLVLSSNEFTDEIGEAEVNTDYN